MKFDYIKGKKVLVTGHDGFKGSWLVGILQKLDCNILGLSDHLSENRPFFLSNNFYINEKRVCISKFEDVSQAVLNFQPEIVIHMAAQALVRKSYFKPNETWQYNLIGTLNILEACRSLDIQPKSFWLLLIKFTKIIVGVGDIVKMIN